VNVPLELIRRTNTSTDIEDVALLFVEEEVGRFDWRNNWPKIKAQGTARQRVQEWLSALNLEHNPDEIVSCLDKLLAERSGRWL